MPKELKPCPFCGCKAKISRSRLKIVDIGHIYHIECSLCGAKSGGFLSEELAELAWNRRIK